MTDAEFAVVKARIERLIARWVKTIGLGWWTVKFRYDRSYKTGEDADTAASTAADTTTSWEYLLAHVTFYLPVIEQMPDDELEELFVHECCHILTAELGVEENELQRPHRERVATTLARAFIWCREAGEEKAEALKEHHADAMFLNQLQREASGL